jgi:hypothetical protein
MKIQVMNASGDCQFTDGFSSSEPFVGMTYDGMGPVMFVTGKTGVATIEVDGRLLDVPPGACVRIDNGSGPRRYRSGFSEDVRLAVGKLWAKIHDDKDWDQDIGGGGGVRG